MKINSIAFGAALLMAIFAPGHAEIVEYGGSADALPHDAYMNVVSEEVSPVMQAFIEADDGAYVAVAIRKPRGEGPFPAIVIFHGAPGGRGMDQLVGWSRGDHGGPVWERFLQEGFVVAVGDYRGGDWDLMNQPSELPLVTAIDDGVAVVEHVSGLPFVDSDRISVYGVSLGGNLAMYLASRMPELHAVVVGAPAPIWFLGAERGPNFSVSTEIDASVVATNIEPIRTPILIQVGTADGLLEIDRVLYQELRTRGKDARLEIYEHGYHDFVLGPQGQERGDLPNGEILLQGALDALDRSLAFVVSGQL